MDTGAEVDMDMEAMDMEVMDMEVMCMEATGTEVAMDEVDMGDTNTRGIGADKASFSEVKQR